MQSFSRGWSFLKQAWSMAFKDKDLLKPSVYALIVGTVVSVIGIVPILIAAFIFGDGQFGRIVMGVFGALLMFVQFVISYVFSGMTVHLIYGYLTKGDGHMDDHGSSLGTMRAATRAARTCGRSLKISEIVVDHRARMACQRATIPTSITGARFACADTITVQQGHTLLRSAHSITRNYLER